MRDYELFGGGGGQGRGPRSNRCWCSASLEHRERRRYPAGSSPGKSSGRRALYRGVGSGRDSRSPRFSRGLISDGAEPPSAASRRHEIYCNTGHDAAPRRAAVSGNSLRPPFDNEQMPSHDSDNYVITRERRVSKDSLVLAATDATDPVVPLSPLNYR